MRDIFVSYSSKDRRRVQPIVDALELQGWSVWWDPEIPPGLSYDEVIEQALTAAKCVVVVWSKNSISSRWIRAEAEEGASKDNLVPVLLDDISIPLAFRQIEAARLVDWHENPNHPELQQLLKSVEFVVAGADQTERPVDSTEDAEPSPAAEPAAADRRAHRARPRTETVSQLTKWTNRIAALIWRFHEFPPQLVFFVAIAVGFFLVFFSLLVGVGFFAAETTSADGTPIEKEVGFVWAINWSVTYVVAFPALIFMILVSFQNVETTLRYLVAHNMVVGQNWRPATEQALIRDWHGTVQTSAKWATILCLLALTEAMVEWYVMSGGPLIAGGFPEGFDEMDWSVAALLPTSGAAINPIANAVFSFAAYLVMGITFSIILIYYSMLFAFSNMIYRYSKQARVIRLIPDVNSDDQRQGFEVFQLFFKGSLYASCAVFVVCFMMNVQNQYLRTDSPHILHFLISEIEADFMGMGAADSITGYAEALGQVMFTVGDVGNFTSSISVFLGFVLAFMVLFGPAFVLNFAAKQGRDELRSYIQGADDISHLTKRPKDQALAVLDQMHFWPLNWPRLNHLIVFLMFGFFCITFYRIGLVFMTIVVIVAFTKLVRGR